MSDSLRPHGLQPDRLLCPWDSPGKNTGVGCHFLLQGIVPIQGLNPHLLSLLHWQAGSLTTSTWEAWVYSLSWHIKQRSIGFISASPGGSVIKNLPANEGDMGLILGQEDPLEKKMSTYFIILVWRIPWTEEPGRLWSMGLQRVKHDWTWVRW